VASGNAPGTSGVSADPPGVEVRERTEVVLLRTGSEGMYMLVGWLLSDDVSVYNE
jgi:hypothetical protein